MPSPAPKHVRLVALILFAATLLLFARSLTSGFVNCDDPDYVTNNTHVQAGLTADTIRWAFTATTASNWHPLTWLSHALDCTLWGLNPAGHHATNIFLHALNAVLVFLVLSRLTRAFWTSALCAALFAWHPLRVESVAWVAERKDVLCALFWWLTLWAYVLYAEKRFSSDRPAWRWYAAALGSFALALLSKPMAVTLPFVLLLLDFWPLRRFADARTGPTTTPGAAGPRSPAARGNCHPIGDTFPAPPDAGKILAALIEKVPFFALTAASCAVTYLAQRGGGAVSGALPLSARLANAVVSIPRYLADFLWPDNLAVLYPHPGYWPLPAVLGSVLFVLAATALALAQWRRRPWIPAGWLWFLGTLVPVAGIVQVGVQSMADRYTYIPVIGLQIALLWTIRDTCQTPARRTVVAWAAGIVLTLAACLTWGQQRIWKNGVTLFEHTVLLTKANWFAWNNLGTALAGEKRYAEAIPCYEESLAAKPDYDLAHYNLAHALVETGAPARAVEHCNAALKINPKFLQAHGMLANALFDLGRYEEALAQHRTVLEKNPGDVDALNGCGMIFAQQGRFAEAEQQFRTALASPLGAKSTKTRTNLATLYAMTGRMTEAVREFRTILETDPDNAEVHNNLATALSSTGNFAEAVTHYRRAVELRSFNPDAYCNLGYALLQLGRRDDARAALQQALQQRPNHPKAQALLKQLQPGRP